MMDKKGQAIPFVDISPVLVTFMFFVVMGIIIYAFWPTIDSIRLTLLARNLDVLSTIILYGLRVIIWVVYLLSFILSMRYTILSQGLGGSQQ